jgi:hypothetical protein
VLEGALGARALAQRHAVLLGERPHEARRLAQHRRERHGLEREVLAPGLDAGDLEHLVDEVEQVPPGLEDVLHRLALPARAARPRASSWAKPRMLFIGVRSSWLMRLRNSLFARFARSASSFARAPERRLGAHALGDVAPEREDPPPRPVRRHRRPMFSNTR